MLLGPDLRYTKSLYVYVASQSLIYYQTLRPDTIQKIRSRQDMAAGNGRKNCGKVELRTNGKRVSGEKSLPYINARNWETVCLCRGLTKEKTVSLYVKFLL